MSEPQRAVVGEADIEAPLPGQVQIRVMACGVCAWDAYLFRGRDLREPFPFRFGHEAAGFISAVGDGVEDFAVGERVFSIDGAPAMSEYINIRADFVGHLPASAAPQTGAEFAQYIGEPAVCVVNGMSNITRAPGDDVAVIGAGYMGLLNVQAYRHSLINKLICFDIDPERLALAKKYGADECWRSDTDEGRAAIQRIAAAGGVNIAVECSGSQPGLNTACELVCTGGTVSNFAWHRAERTVNASPWHLRGLRIINTAPAVDRHFNDHVPQTARLFERGVFDQSEMITHIMPACDIQQMLETAVSKADGYIKGAIAFD